MKVRKLIVLFLLVLIILLPSQKVDSQDNSEIVWVESKIEDKVREMLGKPDGVIFKRDLGGISKFELNYAEISRIDDIAHFSNLTSLELLDNKIIDLAPLSDLIHLITLSLSYFGWNFSAQLDISPLSGLVSLTHLNLYRLY